MIKIQKKMSQSFTYAKSNKQDLCNLICNRLNKSQILDVLVQHNIIARVSETKQKRKTSKKSKKLSTKKVKSQKSQKPPKKGSYKSSTSYRFVFADSQAKSKRPTKPKKPSITKKSTRKTNAKSKKRPSSLKSKSSKKTILKEWELELKRLVKNGQLDNQKFKKISLVLHSDKCLHVEPEKVDALQTISPDVARIAQQLIALAKENNNDKSFCDESFAVMKRIQSQNKP